MEEPEDKDIVKTEGMVIGEREQSALEVVMGGEWKKYTRVVMSALGALPWIGSIISATATLSSENEQGNTNKLLFLWIKEHETKFVELKVTLNDIFSKFESFGDRISERIESEEYLSLVRKTFKAWDKADTQEKRKLFKKLITNAGGIELCSDDLIRLFIDWIDNYHEFHFAVIREIYNKPQITRKEIWINIKGEIPRDDSAEAHLFKLLITDLNRGEVIGQFKEVNSEGDYLKRSPQKRNSTNTLQSAFEDTKPYVLTELGEQFVHYVMSDLAPQLKDDLS